MEGFKNFTQTGSWFSAIKTNPEDFRLKIEWSGIALIYLGPYQITDLNCERNRISFSK